MASRIVAFLLVAALLVSLLPGGASTPYPKKTAPPPGVRERARQTGEEELEAIPEPVVKAKKTEPAATPGSYVPREQPPQVEETDLAAGFRVQVFASSSLEKADEVAKEMRARFRERVYVEYSAPLYKIRMGDFATKEEASLFREKLVEAGYEGAWVVEALVKTE
ncbi:MAG: SPOR domain-containing protein [Candidatus Eisenbacteria bacterium]